MYPKYVALFVLISLAQQGLAVSIDDSIAYIEYLEKAGTTLHMIGTIFSPVTAKTLSPCKELWSNTVFNFGKSIELAAGFGGEISEYYRLYKLCDTVTDTESANKICREATKYEYFDALKTRYTNFISHFKGIFTNLMQLPTCPFRK